MPSIFRPGLFDGKVAIVTGGGSGIGLAIARTLVDLGARVAIAGRDAAKLERARDALAGRRPSSPACREAERAQTKTSGSAPPAAAARVHAATCDIREVEQVASFVKGTIEKLGPIDVLVNNAGGQFPTSAETLSPKGWDAVIRNNLNGTFFMTREVAVTSMIPRRRGRIVSVIANVARGFPGMVHTGAARAGVDNMTKTLAVEWAQYDVAVNAIAPGIVRTTGTDRYPPELLEMARLRTPMKRLGTSEEVAELCAYLASDAAHFVTGVTWYIDGGAHLWGDTWVIPDREEPAPPEVVQQLPR